MKTGKQVKAEAAERRKPKPKAARFEWAIMVGKGDDGKMNVAMLNTRTGEEYDPGPLAPATAWARLEQFWGPFSRFMETRGRPIDKGDMDAVISAGGGE